MITLTKVNCKPTSMNLEDEGKFPVEKDFQDSLNVFYVNEVFISLIRRDGLRGLSKIEKYLIILHCMMICRKWQWEVFKGKKHLHDHCDSCSSRCSTVGGIAHTLGLKALYHFGYFFKLHAKNILESKNTLK